MKITIIGWYGTETIGDRAILAGLISFFHKAYDEFEIQIGSLYPFFTERTINEDYDFYKKIIQKEIDINIFNSKDSKALNRAIKDSDLLVMGGGPLMDLSELFMVEYAFKKAKKLGIKTALLGCGVGPLFHKKYRKSVLNITLKSDLIILRDNKSKDNLLEIYKEFNIAYNERVIYTSYDPAVECALVYKKVDKGFTEASYMAVNLREFPVAYNSQTKSKDINQTLQNFIYELSAKYTTQEIKLIPMHYFHIGNDDRAFLNDIAMQVNSENIVVQNSHLTLMETMELYQNASFNIGMRFHSVVLQTILSGKNYVLDYTEPKRGKISGFLEDIDKNNFFKERYISLQEDEIGISMIEKEKETFIYNEVELNRQLKIYVERLKEFNI